MECPVCLRDSERLPFFCTTCARNALYESRLENAQALVHKESLVHQVEEIAVRAGDDCHNSHRGGESTFTSDNSSRIWALEHTLATLEQSTQRTKGILANVAALKTKLEESKAEISRRKTDIAQRRSNLAAAKAQISERRVASQSTLEKSIKRIDHLWGSIHVQTSEARSFLCHEAAILYGLKQRKRKKGGVIREEYVIGTVSILDLQELNSANAATITACYSNIASLLVLISNYLSLRLPAEITIPRRGYPQATIFAPLSSYQHRDVPFPGITPSHSSTNSPSASRINDLKPLPRPRPLFTNKKLPRLSKEDQVGYSLFLEGVTLLAWDVAWACRTQGMNVGNSWEDVCAIGRNLWQLVVGPPQPSPAPRRVSSREIQVKAAPERDSSGTPPPPSLRRPRSTTMLGQLSHGTAHSFLRSIDGGDLMKPWKFQSHLKIVDKLRATLHGEMNNAEWELLEEKEWDDGGYQFNEGEAVLVRTKPLEGASHPNCDAISTITAPNLREDESSTPDESEPSKARGTSGWTKLKPR